MTHVCVLSYLPVFSVRVRGERVKGVKSYERL